MPLVVYTLLRLGLLGVALLLGYVLGLRSWLLVVVAVVVAALVSYLALPRQRAAAAAVLAARRGARVRRPRPDGDAALEDAVDDAARGAAPAAPGPGPGPSERERDAEEHAVGQLDEPRPLEDDDQVPPGGAAEHHPAQPGDRDR